MDLQFGSVRLTGTAPTERPDALRIVPTYEVQEVKPVGAAGIVQIDRGNDSHVFTWGIWRMWLDANGNPDRETAYAFLATHEIQLRTQGIATLTYTTNAGTFYYLNAAVKITEMYADGCSTYHRYSIKSGALTTQAPPGAGGVGS